MAFYVYANSPVGGNASYSEMITHNVVKVKTHHCRIMLVIGIINYMLTEELYSTKHTM